MKFRPLHDKVLVRKLDPSRITPGGIVIPDTANKDARTYEAEVVKVGDGRQLRDGSIVPPSVKPGDRVICHTFAPDQTFQTDEGETLYVVPEGLGVILVLDS